MRYRIAADTGGTFTDVALSRDGMDPVIGKSLTTRARVFEGIEAAIANAAQQCGTTVEEVIPNTDIFIYGTTHATNAIVVGATAKTAFLCTRGFADTLVLREGGKRSAFDFRSEYPKPYIPRSLTFEVAERIDAEGGVVEPLDENQVRSQLLEMKSIGVEAVAVCLLWSVVNPAHENAVGRLIEECLPGVPFTLSHRLNPIVREYRRGSSAAIDASLKPLMQTHLSQFLSDLESKGFKGSLLTVTSIGGAMHVEDLVDRPIYTVRSGPAMAPVAATVYGAQDGSSADLIVCDTGGTTFDVSLIRAGQIKETRETWLGGRFVGNITGLSSVDVQSIGSGGGSIAWVDSGGMLRVGPRSAGAEPGPACYGRGGSEPTVTDAALVLGFLDPAHFLGGRMSLDLNLARQAIDRVASQLSISVEEAAYAIYVIATEAMVGAIREITIEEGIDPRECRIVAGGGAAGLNAAAMASELGVAEVLVPRTAGALSACGGLYANVMTETSATFYANTQAFPIDEANEVLARLEQSLSGMVETLRQRGLDDVRIEYRLEARYPFQSWELEVPLPFSRFATTKDVDRLRDAFHAVHDRVFAVSDPGQDIECLFWRARLVAPLGDRPSETTKKGPDQAPRPRAARPAVFGREAVMTHRYEGNDLLPGTTVTGPAVIDEMTTTIVVPPGSVLRATEYNYAISVATEA
ncbi:hydantoinase/oxoprolinase family protein [Mesorhizobium sp. WSM4976]|uniref:hydantoinase/oxoprolinase family protein n=1 Tax=Mesorhizobium sp. WSM4976 TaxID=3038549 RepID=UPI002417EC37|nr:hydantoinase/oxoprolinase family protein [Mesorhizobium sp. WSM4976]MDG4898388.1 hydantoinase/oxoprolinase family protein [Mesorhizobium sp. WSM4976]